MKNYEKYVDEIGTYNSGAFCSEAECCCDDDALFAKWYDATSIEESAKIAKQIAELPEREVKDE